MTTSPDIIGKVSYNNQRGFIFTDASDTVHFGNRQYECTIWKQAINAIEFRIIRNWSALIYAVIAGFFYLFRNMTDPEIFMRQMNGYWGTNTQYLLFAYLLSGLIALGIFLYPNSKLIIHAGSFKCVIDGPDEKLARIASRLHI